jgi:hypothetical protein
MHCKSFYDCGASYIYINDFMPVRLFLMRVLTLSNLFDKIRGFMGFLSPVSTSTVLKLLPSKSFPIHCSQIILSFDAENKAKVK